MRRLFLCLLLGGAVCASCGSRSNPDAHAAPGVATNPQVATTVVTQPPPWAVVTDPELVKLVGGNTTVHQVFEPLRVDIDNSTLIPAANDAAPKVTVNQAFASTRSQQIVTGRVRDRSTVEVYFGLTQRGATQGSLERLVYDFVIHGSSCIPSGPTTSPNGGSSTRPCDVHVAIDANSGQVLWSFENW